MIRSCLRRWRRNPSLAAHHLATIGLGMAAVTAVVSLMLAVAFQPLPFRDSPQLVEVWNRVESGAPIAALSGAELVELQTATTDIFASFGGFQLPDFWLLDERGSAEPLQVVRLDVAGYRALDLTPVVGRPIREGASGTVAGLGPVWISSRLWHARYGGNASVVGETIRLAQTAGGLYETRAEIAGVLPANIRIPHPVTDRRVDVWAILPEALKVRAAKASVFFAVGRLRPGRQVTDAQAAFAVVADQRPQPVERRKRPIVQSLDEIANGPTRRTAGLFAVGVALVLLLGFANLSSLTVAESSRRQVELSIRDALGASRWRLWRDIVFEQATLTLCALGIGLPLAWAALRGLTRLLTLADVAPPLPHPPTLNVYVMLGFAACALSAAVAWSTLIVHRVGAGASGGLLRATDPAAAGIRGVDRRAGVWRLGLLSVQATLGIVLMVLAVSVTRMYVRLSAVDLGPAPDKTVVFSLSPFDGRGMTADQAAAFNSDILTRMRSLPDVQATAFAEIFPPIAWPAPFWKRDDLPESPRETTYPLIVSHEYFSTLGIPILFGRGFDDTDRHHGYPAAVIDLEMARRNWRAPQDAVNAQIAVGTSRRRYEVVGVVGSFGGYWAHAAVPTIYLSQNQEPTAGGAVILRTDTSPSTIAERARQVLSGMPIRAEMSSASTIQAAWRATVTRPHARMTGTLLLALIGLILGAQGVYALAASIVTARRQELAIRSALGASRQTLVWLVLRQVIVAVVVGGGLGALAIITIQRVAPQWVGSAASDPAGPVALAFAILVSTALVGAYVPARSVMEAGSMEWLSRR